MLSQKTSSGPASALLDLAAAAAAADLEGVEAAARSAQRQGLQVQVDEVLLQSILFLGYPRALTALERWRRIEPAAAAGGPQTTDEAGGAADGSRAERGERVLAAVYGAQAARVRETVGGLHPDAGRWMVEDGYGRVLARPGLSLRDRELAIVAQLAVLGTHAQLYSHLRGALRCGATPDQVEDALRRARPHLSDAGWEAVMDTWRRVGQRQAAGPEPADPSTS